MIELTVPQPLATLAVEGVVTVLVVPEPPPCPECRGEMVVRLPTQERWEFPHGICADCDDGLARWPAEVTIRSTDERPGIAAELTAVHAAAETMDAYDAARLEFPPGEVVGSVTVEAAVPILGADDIIEESCGWVSVIHRSAYLLVQSESGEHRHGDISDQLAFQEFPIGHTALILGGETDE